MKTNIKWLLLALALTLSVFLVPAVHAQIDGGYMGTDTCLGCHDGGSASDKTGFMKTGHPWKYKHTGGGAPDAISALFPTIAAAQIDTSTLGDAACGNGLIVCDANSKLDWSAINYTVGGFGWKIRWGIKDFGQVPTAGGTNPAGDQTGYLWTSTASSPTGAQYNVENGSWSAYNGNKDKKYECAVCHNTNGIVSTTGYACETSGGTNAAPARTQPWAKNPGMGPEAATRGGYYSSWTFDGVQCEACHGAGQGHAAGGAMGVLEAAEGVEICAKCHIRSENDNGQSAECGGDTVGSNVLTLGAKSAADYIGHHEQYNELVGLNGDGAHASLMCTTCHDPHKRAAGVIPAVATTLGIADGSQAEAGAIRVTCESCHPGKDVDGGLNIVGHAAVTCVDCHMGEATKSATATSGTWGRKGDVKTHIFAINPAGSSTINRSNGIEDFSKTVVANGGSCTTGCDADNDGDGICEANETCFKVAVNALPVNYSCGKCHDLGTAKDMTLAQAQTAAAGYHNAVVSIDNGYIGTTTCLSCHTDKEADFLTSGHPWKYQHTGGSAGPIDSSPLSFLYTPMKGAQVNTLTLGDGCYDALTNPTSLVKCDADGDLDWSAINYTVGGFGWKIRWGVKDTVNPVNSTTKTGHLWTSSVSSPTGAQYNIENNSWSNYNGNKDKKYECAICHNTNGIVSTAGYACVTDGGTDAAPARTEPWASNPGMGPQTKGGYGSSWTFDGVQCEACHGPGLGHNYNAQPVLETIPGVDICAKCHIRSENNNGQSAECGGNTNATNVLTLGAKSAADYIGHHEQYNELVGLNGDGSHASLSCTACHDQHKRAATVISAVAEALGITDNNLSAEARGAVVSCESCHNPGTPNAAAGGADSKVSGLRVAMGDIKCIDCHMGEATKSATATSGTWGRKGDVKTHIFAINPAGSSTINRSNGIEDFSKTAVANGGSCTTGCDADNDGDGICEENETCFKVAVNALPVNYSCGKCHDTSMSDYVGVALTEAEAKIAAAGVHSVNLPPVASFSMVVNANTWTVAVTDTSTDAGGFAPINPIRVTWGDTFSSTGSAGGTFTHTYATAGTYTITLTATDAGGLADSETASATVSAFTISGNAAVGSATLALKDSANRTIASTTSAVGGAYSFANVKPGAYSVTVYKTGTTFEAPNPAAVTVGPSQTVNFATVQTKFKITAVTTGVEDVKITVKNSYGTIVSQGYTNSSAEYSTAQNLTAGTYTVTAYKRRYNFDGDPVTAGNQKTVSVTVGPDKTVTFTH